MPIETSSFVARDSDEVCQGLPRLGTAEVWFHKVPVVNVGGEKSGEASDSEEMRSQRTSACDEAT